MTPQEQAEAILKAAEEIVALEKRIGLKLDMAEYIEPDEYDGEEIDEANTLALAYAGRIASALLEKHKALEEACELIAELLAATGYDKADRKTLQNEYMAGGKGAGTILSCLNFLARQGETA